MVALVAMVLLMAMVLPMAMVLSTTSRTVMARLLMSKVTGVKLQA
jgi:hypothetical protein